MQRFDSDDYPTPPNSFSSHNYPPAQGPGPYPPYPAVRPTNSMAIAALVSSLIVAPLGIIFGHVSLSQIKRSGEDGRGLAIAGLVIGYVGTAIGVIALVVFLVFMAALGSTLDKIGSGSTTSSRTRTTTASPVGVPDATARAIKDAHVGDCIRRVTGARKRDGTREVTVSPASCRSKRATDKVTKRTNSTTNCSGQWVRTTAYSPPIVLCLSKLR